MKTAFVDLKLYDKAKHLTHCGVENGSIFYNLLHTNEMDWKGGLVVRIPLIPGINDDRAELEQMGRFCMKLKKLDHVQLLPYHRLGRTPTASWADPICCQTPPCPLRSTWRPAGPLCGSTFRE